MVDVAGGIVDGVRAAVGEVSGGGGGAFLGSASACCGAVVAGPVAGHDLGGHVAVGGVHDQSERIWAVRVSHGSLGHELLGVGHQCPRADQRLAQHHLSLDRLVADPVRMERVNISRT